MSTDKQNILLKYSEWMFKGVVLIAIVGNLWISHNFVSRPEFEKTIDAIQFKSETAYKENTTQHLMIQTSVADIATTMKLIAANQIRIDDHEGRIRSMEIRIIENTGKIGYLEKRQTDSNDGKK